MNIPAFKNWAAPALVALAVTACSAGGAPTATIPPPAATATRQPALTLMPVVTDMPNAAGVFPILAGFRVLGGVKDGQWLDAPTTASLVPREINFRMFRGSNLATELTGTITMTDNFICISPSKIYIVEVTNNWKSKRPVVGVAGDWDVTPRVPERLGLDNPGDISIVGELLAKNGIAAPEVVLKSVLRVDLEGDGTDEVLITASRMYGFRDENSVTPGIKAGDYSMIVMLKVVDGKVEAIPLILDTYPEEDIMARPWNASVMSVLDLNGDGDLEVVVSLRSFELGRTDVYEVTGDGLSQALTSGC